MQNPYKFGIINGSDKGDLPQLDGFYMARITVEDCLTKENNRFSLVHLASKRAKQLLAGAPVLVAGDDNKNIVMSLREIADGVVRAKTEEDIAREEQLKEEALAAINEGGSDSLSDSSSENGSSDSSSDSENGETAPTTELS